MSVSVENWIHSFIAAQKIASSSDYPTKEQLEVNNMCNAAGSCQYVDLVAYIRQVQVQIC